MLTTCPGVAAFYTDTPVLGPLHGSVHSPSGSMGVSVSGDESISALLGDLNSSDMLV